MHAKTLVIAPSLRAGLAPNGHIRLTEKFVSGMNMTADYWGGPVELLIEQDDMDSSGNLDDVWIDPKDLPFRTTVAAFDSPQAKAVVARAAVVQGGTYHRLNHMPAWCTASGAQYVVVSEYTLRTRWQIVESDPTHAIVIWRRKFWEWRQEKANLAAVKAAAGVQCNGTPTFDNYRPHNAQTMLYFDSRVSDEMMPAVPRLAQRAAPWSKDDPLRLAFSGRLNRMKGADHLPLLAKALKDQGIPFTLDIFGGGPLVPELEKAIEQFGLQGIVRLGGMLDFASELMPTVRNTIDVFVCCHRQGDPSCTYLETLACGVPIVGYDNEAFDGLMRLCPAGVKVPMNDVAAMAAAIVQLSRQPAPLTEMAQLGLAFSREHTFEKEFVRRIEHLKQLLPLE